MTDSKPRHDLARQVATLGADSLLPLKPAEIQKQLYAIMASQQSQIATQARDIARLRADLQRIAEALATVGRIVGADGVALPVDDGQGRLDGFTEGRRADRFERGA